jgi:hypothetical protein
MLECLILAFSANLNDRDLPSVLPYTILSSKGGVTIGRAAKLTPKHRDAAHYSKALVCLPA